MTNNTVTKITIAKEPGAIFATAIATSFIELKNYKYIDFIVSSGVGTAADTTLTIEGKKGDGIAAALAFKEKSSDGIEFTNILETGKTLSIGGVAGSCGYAVFRITADDLARQGFDRVSLKATAVTDSTVPGCIVAVLYEPRYTE